MEEIFRNPDLLHALQWVAIFDALAIAACLPFLCLIAFLFYAHTKREQMITRQIMFQILDELEKRPKQ